MLLRRHLLSFLLPLVLRLTVQATHIAGGEIYYDCIGPDEYRITMVVYRDCAATLNLNNSYTLNLTSPCGSRTLTVSTPGGNEISQLCDMELPNSTCSGGALPGIQQFIYTGTIILDPCDSWTISWTEQWRNNAIRNLTTPGNKNVYIEAVMNTARASCNSSPQFTNLAIPYVCSGFPISYSYGAFDPEGDSLSYEFIGARQLGGAPINYVAGFSGAQPITGITLNASTGLVNFTLNQLGNWVVVVRVSEYNAAGELIGSVLRDMQFVSYPCTNDPPNPASGVVAGLSGASTQLGPRAVEVCESGNFCFDLVITDPNPGDRLEATTNIAQNLPGATFSYTGTNPITCHVCWTGFPGSAGFFPFIVNVNDGACPIPAYQTYVYSIHVLEGINLGVPVVTNESCAGDGNGTARVTVVAGEAPYDYLWSTGATTPDITAGAGTYTVVVSDANGCESQPTGVTIGAQGQPNTADAGADFIACSDGWPFALNGTVTPASGIWSGGGGTFTGTGLNVTYTPTAAEITAQGVDLYLTTTGNAWCPQDADTVYVTLPSSFFGSSITSAQALCSTAPNGSAEVQPDDPTFTYLWDDPAAQTTHTASGLTPGNYAVQLTDLYGCDTTLMVTVGSPAAVAITTLQVTPEQCAGNGDGTITAVVTGGTQPYHYTWSNSATTSSITVGAGTYTLTVTDDNGCAPATGSATVTTIGQPNVANAGADLIGCFSELPVALTGAVTNASGGTWSGGNGTFTGAGLNVTYMPTPAEIAANGVDLYLTTTGNTTCPTDRDTVHVTLPTSFFGSSLSATDATCNATASGSASFLPNNSSFTYAWTGSSQTTAHVTGLAAGNYSVHVTDSYGCDTTLNTSVGQPAAVAIADLQVVSEQCGGNGDGSITAVVTGGTQPYHYTWSNSATTSSITVGAGTYTLTVTDDNGCAPANGSATVTALGQPNVANAGTDLVDCFSELPVALTGAVTNASGGTWSGGNGTFTGAGLNVTYMPTLAEIAANGVDLYLTTTGNTTCPTDRDTVHVTLPTSFFGSSLSATDATCNATALGSASFLPNDPTFIYAWTGTSQTTAHVTGLAAGNYSVHVTDSYGCDTTLNTSVGQPAAVAIADLQVVSEQCGGNGDGSITAVVTGGTQPYHYTWSNSATTSSITVGAGTYTLSVTDDNGCAPANGSATVTALGQPNVANAGTDLEDCFSELPVALTGTVTNASGGTWSGGNGTFTGAGLNVTYMPTAAEIAANGVDLYLTTTGNTTCPADRDTVHVTLPTSFFGSVMSASTVLCAGGATGSASFTPNAPGLTFHWDDPAAQTAATATGLSTGTYHVRVLDNYGCDTLMTVFVPEPLPLGAASTTAVDPTCAGYTNGSATVTASGGTPTYTYIWSDNTGGQSTPTASGLPSGSYTVVVRDANGCTAQVTTTLAAPAAITLTAQVDDTVCVNTPVPLTAQATGGHGGYTINWLGIGTGDALLYSFPASQTISVGVSDVLGCVGPVLTLPVTVQDLSLATLHVAGDTTICPGGTATMAAWVTGYPGNTTLTWPELSGTGPGPFTLTTTVDRTFHVRASDACGNHLEATIPIEVQTPPSITLPPIIGEGCAPLTVHFPTGLTTMPVSYLWNLGDGGTSNAMAPTHVYAAGIHTVSLTVTTPIGCVGHAANTGLVIAHAPPVADFTANTWHTNVDGGNIHFSNTSTGDTLSSDWTFGDGGTSAQTDPTHRYTAPGIYPIQLTVVDPHGCTSSASNSVRIDPVYDIDVPNAFTPDPNGGGGGFFDPTDLSNDVFYPFIRFVKDFRMRIFNRWGELVFESNDIHQGWDGYYLGRISQQDVYVYQLWVRFVDEKEVQRIGDFTLFR